MNDKSGLLIGIGAAADHLGVSRPTIYKYLKLGMPAYPVQTDSGRFTYHFHVHNIDKFWAGITKKSIPDPEKFKEKEDV